jgi:hypothetical protein
LRFNVQSQYGSIGTITPAPAGDMVGFRGATRNFQLLLLDVTIGSGNWDQKKHLRVVDSTGKNSTGFLFPKLFDVVVSHILWQPDLLGFVRK